MTFKINKISVSVLITLKALVSSLFQKRCLPKKFCHSINNDGIMRNRQTLRKVVLQISDCKSRVIKEQLQEQNSGLWSTSITLDTFDQKTLEFPKICLPLYVNNNEQNKIQSFESHTLVIAQKYSLEYNHKIT